MKWSASAVGILLCLAVTFGSVGCSQKDTIPPDVPTSIISTTDLCSDNTPTFSWEAATYKGSRVDYYLVCVDSGDWIDAGDATAYTLTTAVSDGGHTFRVKAVDRAGNEGNEGSLAFTIDTGIAAISGVGVSITSSCSATITWTTSENATSQVEYGTTTSYGSSSALDSNLVTTHSVTLTGLSCTTDYHYRVKSKDPCGHEAVSQDYTFSEGQLLSYLLERFKENIVGTWTGTASNPFRMFGGSCNVEVTFRKDGGYSARNLSGNRPPAFYYGTDADSALKTYSIEDVEADGRASGHIIIYFDIGTSRRGDLECIDLSDDCQSLKFDFYLGGTEPISFSLERSAP